MQSVQQGRRVQRVVSVQLAQVARLGRQAPQGPLAPLVLLGRLAPLRQPHTKRLLPQRITLLVGYGWTLTL